MHLRPFKFSLQKVKYDAGLLHHLQILARLVNGLIYLLRIQDREAREEEEDGKDEEERSGVCDGVNGVGGSDEAVGMVMEGEEESYAEREKGLNKSE